jgi:hypothetical protein
MAEKEYKQRDGNREVGDGAEEEEQAGRPEQQKGEDAQRGITPARPLAHAKQSVTPWQ